MTTLRGLRTLVLGAGVSLAMGCDATPAHIETAARRRSLDEAGVESRDSATGVVRVGMSAFADVDVEPLRRGELAGDTVGEAYHLFLARCGACHDVPSPSAKEAWEWEAVLEHMRANIERAGLLPMAEEEADSVRAYLRRRAR